MRRFNNRGKYSHFLLSFPLQKGRGRKSDGGNVVYGLVNMDSQAKNFDENGKKSKTYQGVTSNQVQWYENQINALNERAGREVKNSLFMHVPLYEYVDAWLNYKHVGDFPAINIEARCNEPEKNVGFYDKIKALNSTEFVAVGHDHDFNWL